MTTAQREYLRVDAAHEGSAAGDGRRPPPFLRAASLVLLLTASLGSMAGCHTARVVAPPPPLRAASAAQFSLDLEFDEPLDRASAEDVSHYRLTPAAGGATAAISSATLVDTLNGRVVQLLVPDWFSVNPDGTDWTIQAQGVLSIWGKSTGTRSVTFRAGLAYSVPMQAFFNDRCSSCHGASRTEGSYRTDTYAGLLGGGTNSTPNVIAADPTCLTVRKCKPHNSMFNAADLTYFDYELIANWVTNFNARP